MAPQVGYNPSPLALLALAALLVPCIGSIAQTIPIFGMAYVFIKKRAVHDGDYNNRYYGFFMFITVLVSIALAGLWIYAIVRAVKKQNHDNTEEDLAHGVTVTSSAYSVSLVCLWASLFLALVTSVVVVELRR